MCAVAIPVTVFVAPGPDVTRTTPASPWRGRCPSAIWVAPCSWRDRTTFRPFSP